jgi:hypothetical protein
MTSTTATILGIAWAAALGVACVALKVCLGRVRDRRRYAAALAADLAAARSARPYVTIDTFGDHEDDHEAGPLAAYYASAWNATILRRNGCGDPAATTGEYAAGAPRR